MKKLVPVTFLILLIIPLMFVYCTGDDDDDGVSGFDLRTITRTITYYDTASRFSVDKCSVDDGAPWVRKQKILARRNNLLHPNETQESSSDIDIYTYHYAGNARFLQQAKDG